MKKIISLILSVLMLSTITTGALAADFTDISGHWAEGVIKTWSDRGVIQGYNGLFRPNDNITRGEMAVIVNRIVTIEGKSENTFTDLPADAFYTEAVLKLNFAGIMLGYNNLARPTDNITREEAFVIFNRIFEFEKTTETAFPDAASISEWALDSVYALAENKVVNGRDDGCIYPKNNITRAEVMQLLENAYKAVGQLTESEGTIGGDDIETGGIW